MQYCCTFQACKRKFESEKQLIEHIQRRHPIKYEEMKQEKPTEAFLNHNAIQLQIKGLPKIQKLRQISKDKNNLQMIARRSSSKNKKQLAISMMNKSHTSSIIKQSREIIQTVQSNKVIKRPSIKKHTPKNENKEEKLPEIKQVKLKKPIDLITKQQIIKKPIRQKLDQKDKQTNPFYTTAPNFKRPQIKRKSQSKEKNIITDIKSSRQVSKERKKTEVDQLSDPITLKNQSSLKQSSVKNKPLRRYIQSAKPHEDLDQKEVVKAKIDKKLSLRKEKQIIKEQTNKIKNQYNFEERIIVFQEDISPKLTLPPTARVQYIFANNCGLQYVNLNNVETILQLSLQHNRIKELSFLNYLGNIHLQKLAVDHNQISVIEYLPPNLKVFSASFNKIMDLENTSRDMNKCRQLQQVDLTFNPIRKEPNYKVHLLNSCRNLQKIDGIKVTRIDMELSLEYNKLIDQQHDLIPSNINADKFTNKYRPSTAVSIQQSQFDQPLKGSGKTYDQLQIQVKKLQKTIKQTTHHLNVITQQNNIIENQIEQLQIKITGNQKEDPTVLYNKLIKQCEALELLNFMQYASEEELEEIIKKKQMEVY